MRKITKRTARKLYNNGMVVYTIPCKLNPYNTLWNFLFKINGDFDNYVNACEWYNCNNETGNYLHYYVKEGE